MMQKFGLVKKIEIVNADGPQSQTRISFAHRAVKFVNEHDRNRYSTNDTVLFPKTGNNFCLVKTTALDSKGRELAYYTYWVVWEAGKKLKMERLIDSAYRTVEIVAVKNTTDFLSMELSKSCVIGFPDQRTEPRAYQVHEFRINKKEWGINLPETPSMLHEPLPEPPMNQ